MELTEAERLLAEVVKTWQGDSPEPHLRAVEKAIRYLRKREGDPPNLQRKGRTREVDA